MTRFGFFIGLLTLLTACEVVSVKNVTLPPSPEKLVVVGLATNVGVGVYVSKTSPVLQSNTSSSLLEVSVRLLKKEATLANLSTNTGLYLSSQVWEYNQDYTLQVQHPILGVATAQLEALPARVSIGEATATLDKNERDFSVSFAFRDAAGSNYYAYQVIPMRGGMPLTNQQIYRIPVGLLLTDLGFENQTKKVTTSESLNWRTTDGQSLRANQAKVYLYHLSKNTYDYYRSLAEYSAFYDDTFVELSPVKNNIKNGYGFVGVCAIDSVQVLIR